MKDFKIRVNPKQSEIIQEFCLRNGASWRGAAPIFAIKNKEEPFLYLTNGELEYDGINEEESFSDASNDEVTFGEFIKDYINKGTKGIKMEELYKLLAEREKVKTERIEGFRRNGYNVRLLEAKREELRVIIELMFSDYIE